MPDETGDDPELAAIRARMLRDLSQPAAGAPQPTGEVLVVTDATFDAAVAAHPALVVDCWAAWCGPCRILSPTVEALAKEMAGRVTFAKLDVDANPRTAARFGVSSIPTLLYFRNGALATRTVGALPKPQLAAAVGQVYRRTGSPGPRR